MRAFPLFPPGIADNSFFFFLQRKRLGSKKPVQGPDGNVSIFFVPFSQAKSGTCKTPIRASLMTE